ncbi:hypothetical protein AVEN_196169-1 [Araneus ventricosus]|uniref:Uncharacterized protein n=1 Tax=Araneus ventricosus TaxID=182803 RepID=A0A4Y2VSG6_ARAVE|nr:hypothetical protein AVEN_193881-1 [Araneus ventricosus]GBO27631.1 hypothetical protein AVEN_196169-1 [Araneus ventricosus]
MREEAVGCLAYSLSTVTNTCRLLWLLATDWHVGATPTALQLDFTGKMPQQPRALGNFGQIGPHVFREAVPKVLNTLNKWAD